MLRILTLFVCACIISPVHAQQILQGRVMDAQTHEALSGVSIQAGSGGCSSDAQGLFSLSVRPDSIYITHVGYNSKRMPVNIGGDLLIYLDPLSASLNEVIVSAGRDRQLRTQAPIAISTINTQMLRETKATSLEQVLNKISGVYMVDLGNEQHSMAIRQPISTRSLFLYLEDGIPIRTTGDFNHNALIEINMAALKTIEVIRGPASSLYGSEAVGGAVNFITLSPSILPTARIQAEMSNWGYKRTDFSVSGTKGKLGVLLGGYYANQSNGYIDHSDFHKLALTLKTQYQFSERTQWTNTISLVDYKTDQTGGIDSTNFYTKNYKSFHTFSYRMVKALRVRSTVEHQWNEQNSTSFNVFYRNNEIGQNPFYAIRNRAGNPLKANGEINSDSFQSFGLLVQHKKRFNWKNASLIAGLSTDYSPATYYATYIDVDRTADGYYTGFTASDSVLTDYRVGLLNTAVYAQAEMSPTDKLKLIAAFRYDRMDYDFDNHLPPSAFTGSPDERNYFHAWTPKLGLTYDFGRERGLYANYSVGFAPPNITELYRGVKVPVLKPATYNNYEIGGWFAFAKKGYVDVSVYQMDGRNEIVSIRLADGSSENRNAGKTRHRGVEWNLRYNVLPSLMIRTGGTFAQHDFIQYQDKAVSYDGNRMNTAPEVITNTEITWKPAFLKGVRTGIEWQHVGSYFMDPANTEKYGGYDLFNARIGYTFRNIECWVNCRNVGDVMYATTVDKSAFGKSYRPGPNRTFNFGAAYTFTAKK